ncbi:MAG: glycosyltransferase family 4 protein [Coriobacteriia bacterium]|nr:glycosyltransferase family 4 protein [Coriobacteriia bacterium]
MSAPLRLAYLSLQAVVEGQDTWAAVNEVISGFERAGCVVERFFPQYGGYGGASSPSPIRRLIEMIRVQRRLARRIPSLDAVYIRAHPLALAAARAAHEAGVPVIQECNGPYEDLFVAWPATRPFRPLFESMQRWQYRKADAIISVAEGLTEWLSKESGNPHIVTNGNGANDEVFRPDAPPWPTLPGRYAVFFGQFPAWQGIGSVLEAVRHVEWPADVAMVFVGDGAMRPAVERAVQELPGRVFYLGRLPYGDVPRVAAHAVCSLVPMVMPERDAKFSPLKLYESMACGVPVVASDTVGISEVVREHRCGLLVPPGDAAAIARAVATLAADPATAAEMGRRGREAVEQRYSWKVRAQQRLEVVLQALRRRREGC